MRALWVVAILGSLASCQETKCGTGTFASGDECLAYDPNDKTPPVVTATPPGGRSRDPLPGSIALETDEPARIIYTTDGSDPDPTGAGERDPVTVVDIAQGMTVKYMAIDAAGNASEIGTARFETDIIAPPAVTNMTVQITGTTAMVTWTNPSGGDYVGTVLARVGDVADKGPPTGTLITGATTLSPSVQVVSVGTAGSFADPGRPPGPVRYVAWTFDDLGNYSRPVAVGSEIALGTLTGQLTYDVDANAFAVAQAPPNFEITGTAMLNTTTLTVNLSIKNTSAKFLQNPKLEITGVTNATFSNSNGVADTFPFRTLGPGMLAPGATVTRDLVFDAVNAGTTVTVNVAIAHHPLLYWMYRYGEQNMLDLGTGAPILPALKMSARGPNDSVRGRIRPALFVGGRYLDVPTSHGAVERFDLVTRTSVAKGNILVGEKAVLQSLTTTGAEMIAVIKKAGRRDSGLIEIVRVDETLQVNGRLELPFSDDRGFSRPALTPDGSTLAVLATGGIVMIDLATFSLIDPMPSTPLVEQIPTGLLGESRSITFFDNGNAMLVLGRKSGEYSVMRRSGTSWTKTRYQDSVLTAKVFSAQPMPDGKIWIATSAGIRVFDPANDSLTPLPGYTFIPAGVVLLEGKIWVPRTDHLNLDEVTSTGSIVRTITVPAANGFYGHWLATAQ